MEEFMNEFFRQFGPAAAFSMQPNPLGGLLFEVKRYRVRDGMPCARGGLLFERERIELCGAHVFQTETHFL